MPSVKALLVLEDGSEFEGVSFGYSKPVTGEIVFNTGMIGYPQAMTAPSYRQKIMVLTYPMIGNYGVPERKKNSYGLPHLFESDRIQVKGLVVSDYSYEHSHHEAYWSLQDWLKSEKVPAITGIVTRELTQKLREHGVMLGKIVIGGKGKSQRLNDPNKRNLVAEVSCNDVIEYGKGRKIIALLDTGVKNNIIRSFVKRNVKVLRVPWNYDVFEKGEKFDALFVTNGPGDPKLAKESIEIIKKSMQANIPTLGICMGNQLIALAAGANTYKLKYGHRSQNQPCVLKGTNSCYITSQNHGFAVDTKSLPKGWGEWFYNANDFTNEGIRHDKKPFYSVQFHPEAEPGPVDTGFLFDSFLKEVKP